MAAITEPAKIGRLLRDIDGYGGTSVAIAYFLKILPYVFTRPSELRLAEWTEIDFDQKLWTVPAGGSKTRKLSEQPLLVPLARQVEGMFRELRQVTADSRYCFPSTRGKSRVISNEGALAAAQSWIQQGRIKPARNENNRQHAP
ncbi:hypothetical protein AGMMS50248_07270 [Deltaproteobacteria bacterium]|nr:hypothetical protein AGMMS50248_07270 [Deltaproteobacteria bacterium]